MLDVPPLRGNPFDTRPIERSRAHEIVGSEEILITWKEHMHSMSPRMVLLVGDRGSGRTSIINAISSQTNKHFVGYYWHNEDPLHRALDEISATFCGHEVPNSMHQRVERIVQTLDSENGPLPLIAFDYPSEVDISAFLSLILPILQRLKALVVVAMSHSQLSSLDENTREVFDKPAFIEPLSNSQIQELCDLRIRRMAREKWPINTELLEAIASRTGGNARSVVEILRALIDEKRGLGSNGTLEGLVKYRGNGENSQMILDQSENPIGKHPESVVETISPSASSNDGDSYDQSSNGFSEVKETVQTGPIEEEEWDQEPDDMWDEEEEWDQEPDDMWDEEERTVEDTGEGEIFSKERQLEEEKGPTRITDWPENEKNQIFFEEGFEPPGIRRKGGFSGLVSRSRFSNDTMPSGPDYSTPIQEAVESPSVVPGAESKQSNAQSPDDENLQQKTSTEKTPNEGKRVFFSEGELWTVDPELEATLPEQNEQQDFPFEEEIAPVPIDQGGETPTPGIESGTNLSITAPTWDSESKIDESHLQGLSDAERLVISIALEREISPSDAEIQARLEVGRPRLSQIYNSLHKSGILSARKEGRSRLFKISDRAKELLNGGV